MSTEVTLHIQDGVGAIRLQRDAGLVMFDAAMLRGLNDAYRRCDADDEVRVVVLGGSGKAFCAGADLTEEAGSFQAPVAQDFSSCPLEMQAWQLRKPVIAAVNGHALGIGLSLALQADVRVFAEEGKYGLLQGRLGVVADNAVEYLLPKLIGFERAFEMIVGGRRLDGRTAEQWQLASRVVPAAEVWDTALAVAQDWAQNCSPLVMALHKRLLWNAFDTDRSPFIAQETRALHHSMKHPDAREGGRAFFEKRAPRWTATLSKDWPNWME